MHNGSGVHEPLASAFSFAVVLFHIAHLAVFPHKEGVDAVMLTVAGAAVVDAAAGNDGHVTVFADEEIVVHIVLQSAFADDNRNMYTFIHGAGLDDNVDAGFVRFGHNVNVRCGIPGSTCTVGTDVVCPHRQRIQLGYLVQQLFFVCVQFLHATGTSFFPSASLSVSTLQVLLS